MSFLQKIRAADSPSVDAFGRWRTAHPTALFSSSFEYDLQPLLWEPITANGGTVTHLPNESSALLTVTGTNGSLAAIQTFQYHAYQPLKSQLVAMTLVLGAAVADVRRRAGQFDASNGVFIEQNGTVDLAFVRRTKTSGSPSDADRVVQTDWNLDTLDGNGPSGLTLDVTKGQILVFDYQWLGVGRVRAGFNIGGQIVYAHEFLHSNVIATVWVTNATLPLRYEIESTAASGGGTMKAICQAVESEGGIDDVFGLGFTTEATPTAGSGTRTYALSIQPRTTFNSIANRMFIGLDSVDVMVTGTNPVKWELGLGQALTTPTFGNVNATYSGVDVDTTGTLSGSPAIIFAQGYCVSGVTIKDAINRKLSELYPITLNAAGAVRVLGRVTLYVTGIGGASACRTALTWKEER